MQFIIYCCISHHMSKKKEQNQVHKITKKKVNNFTLCITYILIYAFKDYGYLNLLKTVI